MEGSSSGGVAYPDAKATVIMAWFSLDVSVGCDGRHSTLLDKYERLAFEAQLNRAIVLRQCYSKVSPVKFVHELPQADAPGASQGEAPVHERAAGSLFWRLLNQISLPHVQPAAKQSLTLPHYVRNAHSRRACMKNGDAQITRLCRPVSHYRVIGDTRSDTSPISIHGRRATSKCVTYLISGYGPYATNPRRVLRVRVSYF
jgi:hypothetical protein